jgi:hypothetical protein
MNYPRQCGVRSNLFEQIVTQGVKYPKQITSYLTMTFYYDLNRPLIFKQLLYTGNKNPDICKRRNESAEVVSQVPERSY